MRDRHVVRRKNEAPYRVVTDGRTSTRNGVTLHHADVLDLYDGWASPTTARLRWRAASAFTHRYCGRFVSWYSSTWR